ERRKIWHLPQEIAKITAKLQQGENVVLFPEGTTFDGTGIGQFKSSLFQTAVNAATVVKPVCINYRMLGRERIQICNRDRLFWYADMKFFPHIVKVIANRATHVEVIELPAVMLEAPPTRKHLARVTRSEIESYFEPVTA